MNKKKRDKLELYKKYSAMPRHELVKECVRMGSRLAAMSNICDIEDVYNMYYEQQKSEHELMVANRHLEKVKVDIQKALTERGIRFSENWNIGTLTHFLIKGTENTNQQNQRIC